MQRRDAPGKKIIAMSLSVCVKASSVIKPANPTPNRLLWLSDLDMIVVTHTFTLYVYRSPQTTNSAAATPADGVFFSAVVMKAALSSALVHFYPLAGRLCDQERGRLQLDCNGSGVLFVEAECDAGIDSLGDFRPSPELKPFFPAVDYASTHFSEWPLLAVQLTRFRCGSISLGLAICHAVVDGQSASHFISTWAKIARTGSSYMEAEPFLDRTLLRAGDAPSEPTFDHIEYKPSPRLLEEKAEEKREEEDGDEINVVELFRFSSRQVDAIKGAANDGRSSSAGGPMFTRYESLAAHLWRCTCEARGLAADQLTELQIAVNGRARLRPPLPDGFFGNVVFRSTVVARSGDLLAGGLGYAAGRIRESIAKMDDEYLRSALVYLKGQDDLDPLRTASNMPGHTRFYGCPNMALTCWVGLPLYDADFGWGPPTYVGPVVLAFDGRVLMLPVQDSGDGSRAVAMRLQKRHMEALKGLIYVGL